jgi:4-amino-4-deoxy-L-arabinose transferase-like glycosyltransferase
MMSIILSLKKQTGRMHVFRVMGKPRHILYFLGICAVAALFRLVYFSQIPPGLWYDEARNLWQLSSLMERWEFHWNYFVGEPVYILFAIPGCLLLGLTPQGLRLGSAIAGILTIPAAYFALRQFWGRRTALSGAFLLAILPWHVIFSRIGFRAITMPLFIFLSVMALGLMERRKKGWALILIALFLGLGYHSYIPFKLLFPLLLIYYISRLKEKKRIFPPSALKWAIPALALFILLIIPAFLNIRGPEEVLNIRIYQEQNVSKDLLFSSEGPFANVFKVFLMFIWKGDPNPRHCAPGAAQIPRFLFPFLLVGMWLSLRRPLRPRNLLLLASFILFLLPSIFSKSAPHAIRSIGAIFPVCVFTARGGRYVALWTRRRITWWRRHPLVRHIAVMVFFVFTAGFCAWQYFFAYGRHPLVWEHFQTIYVETARVIETLPENAVVLHEPFTYGKMSFEFLTRKRGDKVRTVNRAEDLVLKASTDAPCYVLFIGREKFTREFISYYPERVLVRTFYAPTGLPIAVLFKVH